MGIFNQAGVSLFFWETLFSDAVSCFTGGDGSVGFLDISGTALQSLKAGNSFVAAPAEESRKGVGK